VPADKYWGAQTQRSLIHFSIGTDWMPKSVYHAYGYVKKARTGVCLADRLGHPVQHECQ
jgi:fumarate hydratase, class II